MTPARARIVIAAVAAAHAAICFATLPDGPFTAPDSTAYLEMQPIVPLGYPLFLRLAGSGGALILQPAIFAMSLAFLGLEIFAATTSLLLTLAVMAGIALTPDLRAYHASILTESLFLSGLLTFLAIAARFVRSPSWQSAMAAAAVAMLTATVRRAAFAFLPVVALMMLMRWRRVPSRAAMVAAAAVPVIAVLGAEALAVKAIHGAGATSLAGRHLFAKAALIDAEAAPPAADGRRARLQNALAVEFAPMRQLIARAPRDLRASLTLYYETCLQGPCVSALRESLALPEAATNELLAGVARERLIAAPSAFASLTAANYASLWTAYKIRHPDTVREMNAFVAANRPLPFEREAFKVGPRDAITLQPSPLVRLLQPMVMAVGWFTAGMALCGVVAASRQRISAPGAIASLAAWTAHGALLLSALAAAGVSRFMVSVLPAVIVSLCVGAWWLVDLRRRRVAAPGSAQYH